MVRVTSEVGRLRQVLLHEPGPEVDRMVPAMMEELLFDDILFGDKAREEHARMRRVLQLLGVEVFDAQDLLAETLEDGRARASILEVATETLSPLWREEMRSASGEEMAAMLVAGIRPVQAHAGIEVEDLFELPPLPNWCFQRDPQVVMGDGVVFASMASAARHREAALARLTFRFHPRLASVPVLFDPEPGGLLLEGGDVLVLSSEVVAVGASERTNRPAILRLARALSGRERGPRWMVVVELPPKRAFMHLDTVLTPVDRDACLVYPPVVHGHGTHGARVFEVDLHSGEPSFSARSDLMGTLASRGLDFEPIACGGVDPIAQQREQWTDGANAMALSPGTILLYDRNVRTAEELARNGFRVVEADDLLLGREEVDLDVPERVCILLQSHEISRARGGPHCLAHPLLRDEVAR
jgi:arginine deiminase